MDNTHQNETTKKDELKKKIQENDSSIARSKEAIKKINEFEGDLRDLNKEFDKYLELLNSAVKGHKVNAMINESSFEKNHSLNKTLVDLNKRRQIITDKLKKDMNHREELLDEYNKELENDSKKDDN